MKKKTLYVMNYINPVTLLAISKFLKSSAVERQLSGPLSSESLD